MRTRLLIAVAAVAVLVGLRGSAVADPAVSGYPDSIASLGDSITRAVDSDALGDRPDNSWSTGININVQPYYTRLLAEHPPIAGNRYNDAVSGAQMDDLENQAQDAVAQGAELVFILMGANDVCTSTEATMTPVATFQAEFEAAMATLSVGLPDARIAVISIPDVYILWDVLKDNAAARLIWGLAGICQSLLANPLSEDPADVQRRANVRQRNMDFNDVLHDVCAEYVHCRFDDYTGFNTQFTPAHISTIDYFHPSVAGQALIAEQAWQMFYDWSDDTPPDSGSEGTAQGGGSLVSLSATDDTGVSGIEYRLGGGWTRYDSALSLATGAELTWRAVDVNGNVEATHTCTLPPWEWPAGDGDCDGYASSASQPLRASEVFMGTDPEDACADTPAMLDERGPLYGEPLSPWPVDTNDDGTANFGDVLIFAPHFLSSTGDANYWERFDWNGDGTVNFGDVLQIAPFFLQSCTS